MSYILDALQRADAQRQRGTVPGLHSQPVAGQDSAAVADPPRHRWRLGAGALILGVVLAILWLWRAPATKTKVSDATMQVPATTPLPTPQPALAPAPVPAAPAPVPPASQSLHVDASGNVRARLSPARPTQAPQLASQPLPAAANQATARLSASAPQEPPIAAVPLLSELPEATRRQLPPLVITGAVYSDNPAQRLLLINNQVLAQGSQVAPELTLEEIRQRNSVFSFHGTRFRVTH